MKTIFDMPVNDIKEVLIFLSQKIIPGIALNEGTPAPNVQEDPYAVHNLPCAA